MSPNRSDLLTLKTELAVALHDLDIDRICQLNDQLTELINDNVITPEFINAHSQEVAELYRLVRESETLLNSVRAEIKDLQTNVSQKRKSSKKYIDVGKL